MFEFLPNRKQRSRQRSQFTNVQSTFRLDISFFVACALARILAPSEAAIPSPVDEAVIRPVDSPRWALEGQRRLLEIWAASLCSSMVEREFETT